MGLIHSRARKKRDRAEARLLRAEAEQAEAVNYANRPLWRQQSIGTLISEASRRRAVRGE